MRLAILLYLLCQWVLAGEPCSHVLSPRLYKHFTEPNQKIDTQIWFIKNTPRREGPMVVTLDELKLKGMRAVGEAFREIFDLNPPNYDPRFKVANLRSGDHIIGEMGSTVTLEDFLGRGNTTHVWTIKGESDWVLRLPLLANGIGDYAGSPSNRAMHLYELYFKSLTAARFAGLPVIDVKKSGGMIFSARIYGYETLLDFIHRNKSRVELERRRIAFSNFLLQLAGQPGLSDVGPQNVVWHEPTESWLISDAIEFDARRPQEDHLHPFYAVLKDELMRTPQGKSFWTLAMRETGRVRLSLLTLNYRN